MAQVATSQRPPFSVQYTRELNAVRNRKRVSRRGSNSYRQPSRPSARPSGPRFASRTGFVFGESQSQSAYPPHIRARNSIFLIATNITTDDEYSGALIILDSIPYVTTNRFDGPLFPNTHAHTRTWYAKNTHTHINTRVCRRRCRRSLSRVWLARPPVACEKYRLKVGRVRHTHAHTQIPHKKKRRKTRAVDLLPKTNSCVQASECATCVVRAYECVCVCVCRWQRYCNSAYCGVRAGLLSWPKLRGGASRIAFVSRSFVSARARSVLCATV